MIRPSPFVTIEGQLHSVRTVINMLHFFKPINCIYHIKTGVFQTDLNHTSHLLPLLSIHCTMYVTTWTISKRGNKWEMLSYEAWTDERTAVCHNKPVFWRAYKNERPISWNYEYIIFGQIIFKTFISLKHLSDYRTVGLSDRRTVGLSDSRTIGLLDCRIIATAPRPP